MNLKQIHAWLMAALAVAAAAASIAVAPIASAAASEQGNEPICTGNQSPAMDDCWHAGPQDQESAGGSAHTGRHFVGTDPAVPFGTADIG